LVILFFIFKPFSSYCTYPRLRNCGTWLPEYTCCLSVYSFRGIAELPTNTANSGDNMQNFGPASVQKHKNLTAWFLKAQVTGSNPLFAELGQGFETKLW